MIYCVKEATEESCWLSQCRPHDTMKIHPKNWSPRVSPYKVAHGVRTDTDRSDTCEPLLVIHSNGLSSTASKI